MKKILGLLTMVFLSFASLQISAQEKVVTLTSLEWPPYSSEALKSMGASTVVATAAFKAMGYTLKIKFYPWNRAVEQAKKNPQFAGYFPEYFSKENADSFIYSEPMGAGPLGFVERKEAPVKWNTLNDLKTLSIGVVDGYINTESFDAMVAAGQLKVDSAVDDATNVVKVANKRIALAVIDTNVLNYLIANDKTVLPYRNILQANTKLLDQKKLYVCFKKDAEGQKWAAIFNEGLKKINAEKLVQDYLNSYQGN